MTTNQNTKRTTASQAKARQAASASAAAAKLVADAASLSDEAKAAEAVHAASTPAEYRAALKGTYAAVAKVEGSAFDSILTLRQAAGEALYGEYRATLLRRDANTKVAAAGDLKFSAIAAVIFPEAGTKEAYTKLEAGKRPVSRSWEALQEDFRLYHLTADGRWLKAYEASLGVDDRRGVRAYLQFAAAAEANAKAEAGETGTSQARSARTKAAAAAEAKRQADAKAEAKRTRDDNRKKAADEALKRATMHPAASILPAFPGMSGADLTRCFDLEILDAMIATFSAWRAHVAGMSAEDLKAAKLAAGVVDTPAPEAAPAPDEMTAAAVSDVASAPEADAAAEAEAALIAKVVAALRAAG